MQFETTPDPELPDHLLLEQYQVLWWLTSCPAIDLANWLAHLVIFSAAVLIDKPHIIEIFLQVNSCINILKDDKKVLLQVNSLFISPTDPIICASLDF